MKHLKKFEHYELDEIEMVNEAPSDAQTEAWYEPEDCEECREECEESGIEYEPNFTWENGTWVCDSCGRNL